MEKQFLQISKDDVEIPNELAAQLADYERTVFDTIIAHGPVTQAELEDISGIKRKRALRAVKRLGELEAIHIRPVLTNLKARFFVVHPRLVSTERLEALRAQAHATHNGTLVSLSDRFAN